MSKTKGLLKKKNLLKTLMYKCSPFKVLFIVFLYAVIVLINFVLPFSELLSCLIVSAVICVVVYFVSGIIAYRNYCYIPLTEEEIKNKGFKNADEYFEYVWNICSYGFKGNRSHIFVDDSDLQKMLIGCMKVFSDNGTIFGINSDMARDITEHYGFLSALELASDKKAEIRDDHVVLSGKTKDGNKKEYRI